MNTAARLTTAVALGAAIGSGTTYYTRPEPPEPPPLSIAEVSACPPGEVRPIADNPRIVVGCDTGTCGGWDENGYGPRECPTVALATGCDKVDVVHVSRDSEVVTPEPTPTPLDLGQPIGGAELAPITTAPATPPRITRCICLQVAPVCSPSPCSAGEVETALRSLGDTTMVCEFAPGCEHRAAFVFESHGWPRIEVVMPTPTPRACAEVVPDGEGGLTTVPCATVNK